MQKSRNDNIFVGDRAYQMTRFLTFKSPSSEVKFSADIFLRTRYFLQGYLLLCLLYLTWNTFSSTCFVFHHNCRYTLLLTISMLLLILAYLPIKSKKPLILRAMLLLPSLYIHLVMLDSYSYYMSIHLIVVQTTFSSGLVLNSWKPHLLFNVAAYGILALALSYLNMEFIVRGSVMYFFWDLICYSIIPLVIATYIEKSRRERWVLVETFKKSERCFASLVEKFKSPVFVLDSTKRVIFANQKGLTVLQKYYKNLNPKIPIQKMNINFVSLLATPSKRSFEKALEESTLESTVKAKVSLREPDTDSVIENAGLTVNNPNNISVNTENLLDSRVERLIQASKNIYEIDSVRTLWKSSHAFLVSIQDITNNVKVQTTMSKNCFSLIQNIRHYIESAQSTFESLANLSLLTTTYKPLIQTISNMDHLQYSFLNTSAIFDLAVDRFKVEQEVFDAREIIVYLLEVLSIKSCKQKNEMVLKFESAFPDKIAGDSLRFTQIIHNLLSNVIENSKEAKIEITCNLKTLLSQGKYLLEFRVCFPANDHLKFDNIRDYFANEDEGNVYSIDILQKAETEINFMLLKPLLEKLNGTANVLNKDPSIEVHFEIPFENENVQLSHSHRKEWNLPLLSKFVLTNTRTKVNRNLYTWGAQPFAISTDKAIESAQSPYIMKERLSERIKLHLSESQSSSNSSSQALNTNLKSQVKTPSYQEFQKQKQTLLKFTGKIGDSDSHLNHQYETEVITKPPESSIKNPESRSSDQKLPSTPSLNVYPVKQSPKESFDEKKLEQISLNIKRNNSNRKAQMKEQKDASTPQKQSAQKEEPRSPGKKESALLLLPKEGPKIELIPPTAREEVEKPEIKKEKKLDLDEMSLQRGIDRVKKGRKKSSRKAMSDQEDSNKKMEVKEETEEYRGVHEHKINQHKPIRPSFFSPVSSKNELVDHRLNQLKPYMDEKKISGTSEGVDEEIYYMTRTGLKHHENNLKVAVGHILLGILTMYGKKKKTSAATSHSKLSEKEERKRDDDYSFTVAVREDVRVKGSLSGIDGDDSPEENDAEKIVKETVLEGKLNAHEFFERIIDLLASRLAIEKNDKEFMVFLTNYVKIIEKKLVQQDFKKFPRGSMISFEEDEDRMFESRLMFTPYSGVGLVEHQTGGFAKRKNSDESIFSINSDIPERNQGLSERMLVTPSVMAFIRRGELKRNRKRFTTPGEISEEDQPSSSSKKQSRVEDSFSNFDDATSPGDYETKRTRKQSHFNEIAIREKENINQKINPFNVPIETLPIFITVRTESQRRKWKGGQKHLMADNVKDYHYMDDFTILVVDDNQFVLKSLEIAPCPYKKNLDYAKNGLEGFKKYKSMVDQQCLYHLILMDIIMPICDGLEATKMIREFEATNNSPKAFICAVSSYEDEASRKKCFEAGMDDYCCKPLKPQTLNRMIVSRCQALEIGPKMHDDD